MSNEPKDTKKLKTHSPIKIGPKLADNSLMLPKLQNPLFDAANSLIHNMTNNMDNIFKQYESRQILFGAGLSISDEFLKVNTSFSNALVGPNFQSIFSNTINKFADEQFNSIYKGIHFPTANILALNIALHPPTGMSLASDLMKQAMQPPATLNLFSNTLQKFFEAPINISHLSDMTAKLSTPHIETNLISDFWSQLNQKTTLDWAPIIQLSATTAACTALNDWPVPHLTDPSTDNTESDPNIVSLDDAREAVFAAIEIDGVKAPQHVQQAFRFIWVLENEIRRFISNVMLKAHGPDWEKRQIPTPMFNSWNEKRQIALKQGQGSNCSLIDFSDFTDYVQVIGMKQNWKIFEPFFKNKLIAQASFQRLFPYRLHTMHGRSFEKDELLIIAGDCQWLLKCLGISLSDLK